MLCFQRNCQIHSFNQNNLETMYFLLICAGRFSYQIAVIVFELRIFFSVILNNGHTGNKYGLFLFVTNIKFILIERIEFGCAE